MKPGRIPAMEHAATPSTHRPMWAPSRERIAAANLTTFMCYVRDRYGVTVRDYAALHSWSVDDPERFWHAVWAYCGVTAATQGDVILADADRMPGARWFPDARLNFAENLLRRGDEQTALVFWGEDRLQGRLTYAELQAEVSRFAQALRRAGIRPGDRVAAYMPNLPGAVIGMLATASLGAVWSSCSPDFGVQGVLDRFGQIAPRILISADGYFYGGKIIDVLPRLQEIAARLPSVEKLVVVPYTRRTPPIGDIPHAVDVHDFLEPY